MKISNDTKRKRLFAWVLPQVHKRVKAAAALENKTMQEWVEEAVTEKEQREANERSTYGSTR